jgi:hypothetical protein
MKFNFTWKDMPYSLCLIVGIAIDLVFKVCTFYTIALIDLTMLKYLLDTQSQLNITLDTFKVVTFASAICVIYVGILITISPAYVTNLVDRFFKRGKYKSINATMRQAITYDK